MAELKQQTVSGTVPSISREGRTVLLNWEANAFVQDGKETVHVHAWATDDEDNPVQVYQFQGVIISPQLGDSGQFRSRLRIADYEADVAFFDVPEPIDVGLQVSMLLSEELSRDQAITDVGNINFPSLPA